ATDWAAIVPRLGLTGVANQLALNCVLQKRDSDNVYLLLSPTHAQIRTRTIEQRLQAALESYFGGPLRLHLRTGDAGEETPAQQQAQNAAGRQQAAVVSIHEDPAVRALCETFNAQVKTDTILPID
nr:DNA polymerase III subunit gamma/tau [Pseudomonadota bacterium]